MIDCKSPKLFQAQKEKKYEKNLSKKKLASFREQQKGTKSRVLHRFYLFHS